MRQFIICALAAGLLAAILLFTAGCASLRLKENIKATVFTTTSYNTEEIVTAAETAAGSVEAWLSEVFTANGQNNDEATSNSVIKSPFHTLYVNGREVPVYTVRCAKGSHSFAWIDVDLSLRESFALEVKLSTDEQYAKCVVLPKSKGTTAKLAKDGSFTSYITELGSYTYTFAADKKDAVTDPTFSPLTIMVTAKEDITVPDGYGVFEVLPGFHENDELEFKTENTVYVIKEGYHDISSIGLPSNSILYIERGAYIKVNDRLNADGSHNTVTALHADYVNNVKIISRGLIDCGNVKGGDGKYKHVFNSACSKNVYVEGLTVINSNTWTMCFYNCDNVTATRNLLLGYRTYSDGIMMSECRNGLGSYNFVRTGDDAIEFKGTGWWGGNGRTGYDCVYEYNDLWTDKGAGYCLTWEASCAMEGMIFRNNSVGFAQPTWAERNAALDIYVGSNGATRWGDITFENIEIYCVLSPNVINVEVAAEGARIENIEFRNIKTEAASDSTVAFRMAYSANGGTIKNIVLKNYSYCGRLLSEADKENESLFCNRAKDYFDELEILN